MADIIGYFGERAFRMRWSLLDNVFCRHEQIREILRADKKNDWNMTAFRQLCKYFYLLTSKSIKKL
jgi:hypothetical protein